MKTLKTKVTGWDSHDITHWNTSSYTEVKAYYLFLKIHPDTSWNIHAWLTAEPRQFPQGLYFLHSNEVTYALQVEEIFATESANPLENRDVTQLFE